MATVKTEPDSGGCSHLQTSRQICKVSSERKVCSEARAQPTHPVPPILRAHLNWQRPFNSRPNYLLSGKTLFKIRDMTSDGLSLY